MKENLEL